MKSKTNTHKLVESALLVAAATVLGLFHLVEMPYGGSVTVASMLPILLVSYRHGTAWGLGCGVVYAVLQQLLGLKNLSYFTTWQSIVAVIVLDYLLAFALVGLGGVFRRVTRQQNLALVFGALLVCALRYACHVIAGATVWAGLSIPTEAALAYSLGYNATYMIPETIVLALAAYYLGSVLDFRGDRLRRLPSAQGAQSADLLAVIAGLLAVVALALDVSLVFSHMQNAESGEFDVGGLAVAQFAGSFWMAVTIISAVTALAIATLLLVRRRMLQRSSK